jgi:hypothetical protein
MSEIDSNDKFRKLIELAIEVSRDATTRAQAAEDFSYAMELISSKQARLELRISFNPVPCITGELIRDEDGEVIGHLFQQQARQATVN